jgi:hypothetical protein
MYQATVYQYNQQGEVLAPTRRGTTYYGPDNHKPLVCYRGLNIDFDFFVKNTDRKPQPLHNKTYTATIIDRQNKSTAITKTLIPEDYEQGKLVLKLDHEETFQLTKKLYDLVITYKETGVAGSYGGTSDQNSRITFVLEVREGALPEGVDSISVTTFQTEGDDRIGARMAGTAQTDSRTGLQTAQVYTTNYTGTYKFQASLSLQPLSGDWFDVPSQSYTVTSQTGVKFYTFYGMYQYVRLVHTPDVANVGTLDKVLYRS